MAVEITDDLVGKRIKFRSVTRWNGRTAVRKVNKILRGQQDGIWALVAFGGYPSFMVRADEILEVVEG